MLRAIRILILSVLLGLWGSLLWGTLLLTQGSGTALHSLCGVWGCSPPTQVLLGCHGFWFILFGLPALLGLRFLSASCLRHLGRGLMLTSLVLIAAVVVVDLWNWWPSASPLQRNYVGRRIGFSILTNVEVPGLEVLLWSAFLIAGATVKSFRLGGRDADCDLLREKRPTPLPLENSTGTTPASD